MSKLTFNLQAFVLKATRPFQKTYLAECGHATKRGAVMNNYGMHSVLWLPIKENGRTDFCHECLSKMAIRCAWCGGAIHVGNPVTLYAPSDSFQVPDYAVRYQEDGEQRLVGCFTSDCAISAADRQGFWYPPGKVHRVPSPIEMLLASGPDCRAVVVQDLGNPGNLGKVV